MNSFFWKALMYRVSNLADVLQVLKCCSPILSNPGKVERGSPPLTKALQIWKSGEARFTKSMFTLKWYFDSSQKQQKTFFSDFFLSSTGSSINQILSFWIGATRVSSYCPTITNKNTNTNTKTNAFLDNSNLEWWKKSDPATMVISTFDNLSWKGKLKVNVKRAKQIIVQ